MSIGTFITPEKCKRYNALICKSNSGEITYVKLSWFDIVHLERSKLRELITRSFWGTAEHHTHKQSFTPVAQRLAANYDDNKRHRVNPAGSTSHFNIINSHVDICKVIIHFEDEANTRVLQTRNRLIAQRDPFYETLINACAQNTSSLGFSYRLIGHLLTSLR